MPLIPPKDMTDADLLAELKSIVQVKHDIPECPLFEELISRFAHKTHRLAGLDK